jgi:hypothetical protein
LIEVYVLFGQFKKKTFWGWLVNVLTGSRINHVALVVREKGRENYEYLFALHSDIKRKSKWIPLNTLLKIVEPVDVLYFADVIPHSLFFNDLNNFNMNPYKMTKYFLTRIFFKQYPPDACTVPVISWLNYYRKHEAYNIAKNYSPVSLWKTLVTNCVSSKSVMEEWKCKSLL